MSKLVFSFLFKMMQNPIFIMMTNSRNTRHLSILKKTMREKKFHLENLKNVIRPLTKSFISFLNFLLLTLMIYSAHQLILPLKSKKVTLKFKSKSVTLPKTLSAKQNTLTSSFSALKLSLQVLHTTSHTFQTTS